MQTNSKGTVDLTDDLTSNERPTNRVTVADAARLLGLSAEAVRMRIKRGTLTSEKVEGTVYVILDADPTRSTENLTSAPTTEQRSELTSDQTDLVEALRAEVAFLRKEIKRREEVHVEENRRKDTIIAQLTQRIPELPSVSATEPREDPEPASETSGNGEGRADTEKPVERSSWLYRFFFGTCLE